MAPQYYYSESVAGAKIGNLLISLSQAAITGSKMKTGPCDVTRVRTPFSSQVVTRYLFASSAQIPSSIVYAMQHAKCMHIQKQQEVFSSRTQGATIKNLEKFSILYFSIYNNIDELASQRDVCALFTNRTSYSYMQSCYLDIIQILISWTLLASTKMNALYF